MALFSLTFFRKKQEKKLSKISQAKGPVAQGSPAFQPLSAPSLLKESTILFCKNIRDAR